MKVFSWLVGGPLAVIILVFALCNRQSVSLSLWPFDDSIGLPVYLVVLLPLLIGLVAGASMAGLSAFKHRRNARRQAKRVADLERQLDALRSSSAEGGPALSTPISGDRSLT